MVTNLPAPSQLSLITCLFPSLACFPACKSLLLRIHRSEKSKQSVCDDLDQLINTCFMTFIFVSTSVFIDRLTEYLIQSPEWSILETISQGFIKGHIERWSDHMTVTVMIVDPSWTNTFQFRWRARRWKKKQPCGSTLPPLVKDCSHTFNDTTERVWDQVIQASPLVCFVPCQSVTLVFLSK